MSLTLLRLTKSQMAIQSAFPLLYLLLERDRDIMKLCLTHVIHIDELYDSRKAICSIIAAIDYRCEDLIGESVRLLRG